MRKIFVVGLMFLALAGLPAVSHATLTTYIGQDDGAPVGGPFPSSASASYNFYMAALPLGPFVTTITFEGLPVGFPGPSNPAPGVTMALSAPNYGPYFSGVSNLTYPSSPNLYGFNITTGGSEWLGFAGGSATFTFASPTDVFGMYMTGLQQVFSGTNGLTVSFNDGAPQVLTPPINVNGGTEFFGFTDPGHLISSVTITDLSNDAWGIDNVSFNKASAVPIPGALLLFAPGLAGLAALRKRIKT